MLSETGWSNRLKSGVFSNRANIWYSVYAREATSVFFLLNSRLKSEADVVTDVCDRLLWPISSLPGAHMAGRRPKRMSERPMKMAAFPMKAATNVSSTRGVNQGYNCMAESRSIPHQTFRE